MVPFASFTYGALYDADKACEIWRIFHIAGILGSKNLDLSASSFQQLSRRADRKPRRPSLEIGTSLRFLSGRQLHILMDNDGLLFKCSKGLSLSV